MLCPPGTYDSYGNCIQCLEGTYNPYEGGTCKPCPPASYNPLTGQDTCLPAPRGSYTDVFIGAKDFINCPVGFYQENVGFGTNPLDANACHLCPEKTYSDSPGQTKCTIVQAGWYTNLQVGATKADACPLNYSNPSVGFGATYTDTTACDICSDGAYTTTIGATSCIAPTNSQASEQAELAKEASDANTLSTTATAVGVATVASVVGCAALACLGSCFPEIGTWIADHIIGWIEDKLEALGINAGKGVLQRAGNFFRGDKKHKNSHDNSHADDVPFLQGGDHNQFHMINPDSVIFASDMGSTMIAPPLMLSRAHRLFHPPASDLFTHMRVEEPFTPGQIDIGQSPVEVSLVSPSQVKAGHSTCDDTKVVVF